MAWGSISESTQPSFLAVGMCGALDFGGNAVAEFPAVVVGVDTLVFEGERHRVAPLESERLRLEAGQRLAAQLDVDGVARLADGTANETVYDVRDVRHVAIRLHGGGDLRRVLAEGGPDVAVVVGCGVRVAGVEFHLHHTAEGGVRTELRIGRPVRRDGGVGVPHAAEFVVDGHIEAELAGGVGREDVGLEVVVLVHLDAAVVAEVVVVVGVAVFVGVHRVGRPHYAVDSHLVFAAAVADAADVEAPVEYPAVVDTPVVADFDFPSAIQVAANQFLEAVGRHIIIGLLSMVR